jgi:hypothetical protein
MKIRQGEGHRPPERQAEIKAPQSAERELGSQQRQGSSKSGSRQEHGQQRKVVPIRAERETGQQLGKHAPGRQKSGPADAPRPERPASEMNRPEHEPSGGSSKPAERRVSSNTPKRRAS